MRSDKGVTVMENGDPCCLLWRKAECLGGGGFVELLHT